MGVRIEAYAVDLPPFDAFLNTPLGDLLRRYQKDGNDEAERLMFTCVDSDDTFVATPSGPIYAFLGAGAKREKVLLTDERSQDIRDLQRPAREHLSLGSIYEANWLLRAFSNCKGIGFIQRLIDGHRMAWLGSVLQSGHALLERHEYQELELLFRRILRGVKCGYKIPKADVGLVADGLPFVPEENVDHRFGRWSEDEAFNAAVLLSKIMASSPTFTPPPGPIGIAPDESEWHKWFLDNVSSLLRIPNLNYRVCNVLTFIG